MGDSSDSIELGRDLLRRFRIIAVVGLSSNPDKPAHVVPKYLQAHGYRVIPVNPTAAGKLLGETVFARLSDLPTPPDIVLIFRPSEAVPTIVQEAIAVGAKAVWMQEGIAHESAAEQARNAGLSVVQNRCAMKLHRTL